MEKERLTFSPRCVSNQRGKCHSLNTRHPSQGRIPWRNSHHHPRFTLQTQRIHTWLRGPPSTAHLFVWSEDTQDSQLLGGGHLTSLTRGHPSHSLPLEVTSESNHGFISLCFWLARFKIFRNLGQRVFPV